MSPGPFFVSVLRSALVSSGGFGNVPILREDLLSQGVATDRIFVESLAVGQISPGPNGLWVVCLGYFVGGWEDAALALLAVTLPPLLILLIKKLYERHREHPGVEGFMTGLEIAVIALFVVTMLQFLGGSSAGWLTVAAALGAFGLTLWGRVPVVAILGLAAVAGAVWR